ncbi:hypothetical protein MSPP1_001385 [Malassezia sp. CBS 17886]|nr:hypothetical protein MSPP1_001385 [Malassezia sp. CBS 17886]
MQPTEEGDPAQDIAGQYFPLLDPSLVLAIAQEPGRTRTEAVAVLDELAAAARAEDAAAAGRDEDNGCAAAESVGAAYPGQDESDAQAAATHDSATDTPELLFMQHMFPSHPPSSLQAILVHNNMDLDASMDELFVAMLLDSVTRSPEPPACGQKNGLDIEALADGLAAQRPYAPSRRKHARAKAAPVKVSLTDQRSRHHIYYDHRMVPRADAPREQRGSAEAASPFVRAAQGKMNDRDLARELQHAERGNAADDMSVADHKWLLVSSTLSHLAELVQISLPRVRSMFHEASLSVPVTVARVVALAAASPDALAAAQHTEFPVVCDTLAAITERPREQMRRVLLATHGVQDAALDLLELEDTVASTPWGGQRPDVLDPTAQLIQDSPESRALATNSHSELRNTAADAAAQWLPTNTSSYAGRTVVGGGAPPAPRATTAFRDGHAATILPASAAHVPPAAAGGDPDAFTTDYSVAECRTRVDELRARRNAALRQAASSVRRGGAHTNMGGAAIVYAEEASKLDAEARRWQMRAATARAEQTLSTMEPAGGRRVGKAPTRIDLHQLTVHEALTVVAHSVGHWQATQHDRDGHSTRAPLEIVTGRGLHSRHHTAVIRPAVIRLLQQRGHTVDATSHEGVVYVKR